MTTPSSRIPHRPSLLATALVATVLLGSSAGATTIFTDDFSASTRTNWYVSSGPSTAVYTQNVGVGLVGPGESSSRHMVTSFSPTTLAVGETLTVNFTLSVSADTTTDANNLHQFRFGVFDSASTGTPDKDNHGVSGRNATPNGLSAGFDQYVGYSGTMTFSNTGNQLGLRERGPVTAKQLLTSGDAFTGYNAANNNLATNANTSATKMFLSASEVYSVSFSLSRVATDQVDLHLNISGTDVNGNSFSYYITGSDYAGIISSFDVFAFSINNSTSNFMLRSIDITHTAAVPEPASAAGLAAGIALGGACLRRRRRT